MLSGRMPIDIWLEGAMTRLEKKKQRILVAFSATPIRKVGWLFPFLLDDELELLYTMALRLQLLEKIAEARRATRWDWRATMGGIESKAPLVR
jgi:hypothetical protein